MTEIFTIIGAVVSLGALCMLIAILSVMLQEAVSNIRRR